MIRREPNGDRRNSLDPFFLLDFPPAVKPVRCSHRSQTLTHPDSGVTQNDATCRLLPFAQLGI